MRVFPSLPAIVLLVAAALTPLSFVQSEEMNFEYTIEVLTDGGVPLAGVPIYGTDGFNTLAGRLTGTDGEFRFDVRDLESAMPTLYMNRLGYQLDPPELTVSPENCPDRICEVTARLSSEETVIISVVAVNQAGQPLPGVRVAVSGIEHSAPRVTGNDGFAYFSAIRRGGSCSDSDQDPTNDYNTVMAAPPLDGKCSIQPIRSKDICPRKSIRAVVIANCSSSGTELRATNGNYAVQVVDSSGQNVAADFTVSPGGAQVVSARTNVTNFSLSQLGISSEQSAVLIPTGDYQFYPQEQILSPESCPNNLCTFFAKPTNQLGQRLATVQIADVAGDGTPGVSVVANNTTAASLSKPRVTDADGKALFAVQPRNFCNEIDRSTLNDYVTLEPHLTGCAFFDESDLPFQFCPTSLDQEVVFSSACSLDAVSGYTVRGRVMGPNGEPFPGVKILKGNEQAAITRDDGSYTVTVDKGDTVSLRAESSPFLFDPKSIELVSVHSSHTDLNFTVYSAEGGLDSATVQAGCAAEDQYRIQGTIFNQDGEPLTGAAILNNHNQVATSAADGSYSFLVDAHSDNWVTAEYNDEYFDPAGISFPYIACHKEEVNFQVSFTPGYILSGQVTYDDGTPITEASITCVENSEGREIVTDSDGYYSTGVLDGASYSLQIADEALECTPGRYAGTADASLFNLSFVCSKDYCPSDPDKLQPGQCGCGNSDRDGDRDGVSDCNDLCKDDTNKVSPGTCGCGVLDSDSDQDGALDCVEECDQDPRKTTPGVCGCNVLDIDSDQDGRFDCVDGCPSDPAKVERGICGCGVADVDQDGDGALDCQDSCPTDGNKINPGQCGCGVADTDRDGDGRADCNDLCLGDPDKTEPGVCGCGVSDIDSDGDGTPDCNDLCPNDTDKVEPGQCGCGTADIDADNDGVVSCEESCDNDPNKTEPGICGCGIADTDSDLDGTYDCNDQCVVDPAKTEPGACGCGVADIDTDEDGTPDCNDACPVDPAKSELGVCGCGIADRDIDSDGQVDCPITCENPTVLDFELGSLPAGTRVSDQFLSQGVSVASDNRRSSGPDVAILFDSSNPTGGDDDLGTPNENYGGPGEGSGANAGYGNTQPLGNVLIIAENTRDRNNDGLVDNPDDEANGGTLRFEFTHPAAVQSVTVLDIEHGSGDGNVVTGTMQGEELYAEPLQGAGDNSVETVTVENRVYVESLEIDLRTSGAVAQVSFCPTDDLCFFDDNKTEPGVCGCGVSDEDTDSDGTPDCNDQCPTDPLKTVPGQCGCGSPDDDLDNDGVMSCRDACDSDPNKTTAGICGCGVADIDTDLDGTYDCNEQCPLDADKTAPGSCGCGVADTDSDGDGIPDCSDLCSADPNKDAPGQCGCGVSDRDSDGDGTPDCQDLCPNDGDKVAAGVCGCGTADIDADNDGVMSCKESCDLDPLKTEAGICGCGVSDIDRDGDGTVDCKDSCPLDAAKTSAGLCGCGVSDADSDGDGTPDCKDQCSADPLKTTPGQCGCGVVDTDSDGDGVSDCKDLCSTDPNKASPGMCGCGAPDRDSDGDGTPDCLDLCEDDSRKTSPGQCGCGVSDADSDNDGTVDCLEQCDEDPRKLEPGVCGCGVADTDLDGDNVLDCREQCDADPLKLEPGICGCGIADVDSDLDGVFDCNEECTLDPDKTSPGICGCGVADTDSDGDGTPDCLDFCPSDSAKSSGGQCGCGVADTDSDGDGVADCRDQCVADANKSAPGICGCGHPDSDVNEDGTVDCGFELIDSCIREGITRPQWKVNNHNNKQHTVQITVGDEDPLTITVNPNHYMQFSSTRLEGDNVMDLWFNDRKLFSHQHRLHQCPPDPVEISGALKMRNGRKVTEKSRIGKLLRGLPADSLQIKATSYDTQEVHSTGIDENFSWKMKIPPKQKYRVKLYAEGLVIRSKPKTYRMKVVEEHGGMHWALRKRDLVKIIRQARKRARSRMRSTGVQ